MNLKHLSAHVVELREVAKRRLRARYGRQPEHSYHLRLITELLGKAYKFGYADGHEDQMQMRIRDRLDAENKGYKS